MRMGCLDHKNSEHEGNFAVQIGGKNLCLQFQGVT